MTRTVTCPRCGRCIRTASMAEEAHVLALTSVIYCPVLTSHGSTNPELLREKTLLEDILTYGLLPSFISGRLVN